MQPDEGPQLGPPPPERRPLLYLVAGALVVAGALIGFVRLRDAKGPAAVPPKFPPLSAEAQPYSRQLEISKIELSRWANFLGLEVIYLDAKVTNAGARRIAAAELTFEFQDRLRQVVLRDTLRLTSLAPGEALPVRVSFDRLPADWNGLPPEVRITGLILE